MESGKGVAQMRAIHSRYNRTKARDNGKVLAAARRGNGRLPPRQQLRQLGEVRGHASPHDAWERGDCMASRVARPRYRDCVRGRSSAASRSERLALSLGAHLSGNGWSESTDDASNE
jgi:hypothetical protein